MTDGLTRLLVGRVPGAIRVAPGDDREDITMPLPLPRSAGLGREP